MERSSYQCQFLLPLISGFRALLNEFFAAELDFDKTIFTVSQMNNGVAFLPVFVSVMVNLAVQSVGKNTKIPDTQRFKEKTESIQIIYQVIRTDAQSSGANRRVNIIAGIR